MPPSATIPPQHSRLFRNNPLQRLDEGRVNDLTSLYDGRRKQVNIPGWNQFARRLPRFLNSAMANHRYALFSIIASGHPLDQESLNSLNYIIDT